MTTGVFIAGVGVALPSGASPADLLTAALDGGLLPSPVRRADSPDSEVAQGYPDQDAPTAYAISAVADALRDAGLSKAGAYTGVVVASTTSNIDAIARVAAGVATDSYRAVRPTDVLTLAGTQVSAAVSSFFGARAFTYGMCTGNAAGLDAVAIGATGLRRNRAHRVLVVGTEAPGEAAGRMIAEAEGPRPLFCGGIALLTERSTASSDPGGSAAIVEPVLAAQTVDEVIGQYPRDIARTGLVFVPAGTDAQRQSAVDRLSAHYRHARVVDLWSLVGDAQGALGVLQCALASAWLGRNPRQAVLSIAGSIADRHLVSTVLHTWRYQL